DLFTNYQFRGQLRWTPDTAGQPIQNPLGGFGLSPRYVARGTWDAAVASALVGDPSMVKIGMRQDLTAKLLDQAVIHGVSLAEHARGALGLKIRMGWVVLTPTTPGGPTDPYPFAVVGPITPPTPPGPLALHTELTSQGVITATLTGYVEGATYTIDW